MKQKLAKVSKNGQAQKGATTGATQEATTGATQEATIGTTTGPIYFHYAIT